ncbi:hypothetical protein [Calidifontibacillus oryziterrae]|uniref:hypothetical protein n=1 Tax=Calidifontibacillus oryziterrae TaxID=1191699 RepID=UPI0002D35C84|nr:hypothetical protein [Calidifontibacillus oryziterrae]
MAFGNWGGKVYKNNKPLPNHCDQIPSQLINLQQYQRIGHSQNLSVPNILNNAYHAVIGDSLQVLVLLYKYFIVAIYANGKPLYEKGDYLLDHKITKTKSIIQAEDITFFITENRNKNKIEVSFKDPEGNQWIGISGMGIGEGFEKWD